MADISDVEKAIVDAVVAVIYPDGISNGSVAGANVRIYRGWPSPTGLTADLAANIINVSIFSDPKSTRDTTRYPRIWRSANLPVPTLSVELNDGVATFNGTGSAGLNAGVLVRGNGYVVPVNANDTPDTVATLLAAQITGAIASGAALSVTGTPIAAARVEGSAIAWQETRRQEQAITVTLWCPDPASRDSLSSAVDSGLSQIDWLSLADGSSARLLFKGTDVTDASENADLYRRDLVFKAEYPTIIQQLSSAMLFGTTNIELEAGPASTPVVTFPMIGAIRFDAWYDPSDKVDQQCAAALSSSQWDYRLPPNVTIGIDAAASWPLATQAVIDGEITAAIQGGLNFWAFDSYQPNDGLSRALSLYLSSSLRSSLQFCMLGQSSAWGDPTMPGGYAATFDRDIAMMSEAGYVRVNSSRPLYFVLDGTVAELSSLPAGGIAAAIATLRSRVIGAGAGNPYIVWLSGAALADYDNVAAAITAGADAAGAYASPRFTGATSSYANLTQTTAADWALRIAKGFPMIPTAMTGWDQRPLIERPQPFYPLPAGLTLADYYTAGSPAEIADHVAAMASEILTFPSACPAGVGLIYAWNELAEGGWLMPTYTASEPDCTRITAVGGALATAAAALAHTKSITS